MKKAITILCFLLLISCSKAQDMLESKTIINLNKTNIEYGDQIYLYDLVDIENGEFITQDFLIDTYSSLGQKEIEFEYQDDKENKLIHKIKVNIIDTTKPIIYASKTYYSKKGENIDLLSKILCGDNYDRELECKIEGQYNKNVVGEYPLKFYATDSSGNYYESEFKLIIKDKLDKKGSATPYYIKDLINKYKEEDTAVGIDVSSWQEEINWEKVKNSGVEFAMIRIGYGHTDAGGFVMDKYFKSNIKNAKKTGIKVGVYFYSYAKSEKEAVEQAKWVVQNLDSESLDLPIAFDWESWTKFNNYKINFVDLNKIAEAFMKEITKNGYSAMNYGSARYLENIWNISTYPTWLAYYTNNNDYEKDYYIWQISDTGKIDGINGYVDLDILYKKEGAKWKN